MFRLHSHSQGAPLIERKRETEIKTGELKNTLFHAFLKILAWFQHVTLPFVCDEKTRELISDMCNFHYKNYQG